MELIKSLYFRMTIKLRIAILCICYSICMIAVALLSNSGSDLVRYGSLTLFIMLGAFFGFLNHVGIETSISRVIQHLKQMADGDLSKEIIVRNNNEISWVLTAIQNVQTSMRNIIAGIQNTSGELTVAADSLRHASGNMSSGAGHAVQQSSSAYTAVEELSAVSSNIAHNCLIMADKASETKKSATEGEQTITRMSSMMNQIGSMVSETTEAVQSLGTNSGQIGEIVRTIEDIADQTNLLALNAAIEAARAGEMGRGFAVVADEVRNLAERTTGATREIQKIIATLQTDVKNVMASMGQSAESVSDGVNSAQLSHQAIIEIRSHIDVLADSVAQVATAVEEQSATTDGVMQNIKGITNIIDEVSHGTQETDKAAISLARSSSELKGMADRFRV